MEGERIELRVAGHSYYVVSSADRSTLERLARVVEQKLIEIVGSGRAVPVQSLLLAAMALARDVETESERALAAEHRTKEMLTSVLARIDDALGAVDENGEALPMCLPLPDSASLDPSATLGALDAAGAVEVRGSGSLDRTTLHDPGGASAPGRGWSTGPGASK